MRETHFPTAMIAISYLIAGADEMNECLSSSLKGVYRSARSYEFRSVGRASR
jgi:hypothetical protein